MAVPSFTLYPNRPRLWFRDTDKTALTARTDDTSGWKTLWDIYVIPRANVLKNLSESSIVGSRTQAQLPIMLLAFAGWIEETGRPAGGYKDKAIRTALYIAGLADSSPPSDKRYRMFALAEVFDVLFNDMTTTERNTLAAEITQQIDRMLQLPYEWIEGHSGYEQCAALAGELAISGYSTYAAGAAARLQATLEWWYGANPNEGKLNGLRYHVSDGGHHRAGYYIFADFWTVLWSLNFLKNATDLDTWSQESSWLSKAYEYLLWNFAGGSYDHHEAHADTTKGSAGMVDTQHYTYALLADKYRNVAGKQGGHIMRWFYDTFESFEGINGEKSIYDIAALDRAAVNPVAPENATIEPPTSRLFFPPGIYYYRQAARGSGHNRWNFDQTLQFRIAGRKYYTLGHTHLDAGSVSIKWKGDPLLYSPAGLYDSYGTSHHANAYQRTWLQSLAPLIQDPAAIYTRWGQSVVNDGGQQFKKYSGYEPPANESTPGWVYAMQNDAGGLAWRRCEAFDKLTDNASYIFLRLNSRDAYRRRHTDAHRCPILEIKYMIIEPTALNGLNWPGLLYYARIKKSSPSWATQIPFHVAKSPTLTSYGFHALGHFSQGKLWVDVRNLGSYTRTVNNPGTLDANGWGADQFKILGSGTNYGPSRSPNSRDRADAKTYSLYLEKNTHTEEEHYICLLMFSAAADAEPVPSRTWLTDAAYPDWYGIDFNGEKYMVNRTADLAVGPGAAPDVTPPAEVTGFSLAAKNQAILARWTDPGDADYKEANVYIRTSST